MPGSRPRSCLVGGSTSPADFNDQFSDWLTRANARVVRTIKVAPVDLVDADRAAMLPLPPIPLHLSWRNKIRLGRDYCYVRLDTNDYSVDPTVIGRMVDVAADLDHVRVRCEGRIVAEHPRVWARKSTTIDPTHVETASCLRKQFQHPRGVVGERDDQITYLAGALKAPRITEAAARLADQAQDAGWAHEDYLAAVLEREVSARNTSGARLRICSAGFSAVKTPEDFDFDAQPAVRRQLGALASGGFLTEARNVVLLGPPEPARHTSPPPWESQPHDTATVCCSQPRPTGSPASLVPTEPVGFPKSSPGCGATD